MIKCSLTDLGRAGRENIWHSVMAHGRRCARSYAMTSGQIFSRPALLLSQLSKYYSSNMVFWIKFYVV